MSNADTITPCLLTNTQRRRARLKAAGLCLECSRRPPRPARTNCAECAADVRQKRAAITLRKKQLREARYKSFTESDIIYLAGFFDGEGTVSIFQNRNLRGHQKTLRHSMSMHITNTDKPVMEWITATFGGSCSHKVNGYGSDTGTRRADSWRWQLTAHKAARILRAMLPYLKVKLVQSQIALALQDRLEHWKTQRNSYNPPEAKFQGFKGSKPIPQEELAIREQLRQELLAARQAQKQYGPL